MIVLTTCEKECMLPSVLYASSVVGSNFSSPKCSNSAHDGLRGDGPIALRGVDAARRGEATTRGRDGL
jgi:hypothetical protein